MIELHALGGLKLRDSADGREILSVLARAKPSGLLVYMALSRTNVVHSRDNLFELLWPDSSAENARNSLNQVLHILRSGLGPGVIETADDGELFLEAGTLWCDAAAFDEAIATGRERDALELYGGHLWDGSELADCPMFERWLDGERQRLRVHAVEAAVTLAQELERDGSYVDAAQWLRRARDWAPYDEAVMRLLLKLLHGLGERPAAAREYEEYEKRLADVELTPSPDMAELIEKIRSSTAGADPAVAEAVEPGAAGPEAVAPPVIEEEATAAAGSTEVSGVRSNLNGSTPASSRSGRFWRSAAIGAVGAALAALVAFFSWPGPDSSALDPRLVLVRPFSNETGNPELETLGIMAAEWVSQGLAETGIVRVLPATPSDAITEAGTTVSGSFYPAGDGVSFHAQIIESTSGEVLQSIGPILASGEDPRAGFEVLQQRITGALASVLDPLLASWVAATRPPPSYEAYQLFAQGFDIYIRNRDSWEHSPVRYEAAADYFRRAAELDSTYALPLLWEVYAHQASTGPGTLLSWRPLDDDARESPSRDSTLDALTGRRDSLTRWEQHLLDAHLAQRERDELGLYVALSSLVAMTPGSEWNFKLAEVAAMLGRFEEAATLLEDVTDQGWLAGFEWDWWILTQSRHAAGQYEQELRDNRAFRVRSPHVPSRLDIMPLAALGRVEEALVLAREAQNFVLLVSELFAHGHREAAQNVIRDHLPNVDLDPSRGDNGPLGAAPLTYFDARVLFWTGRLAEAEERLRPSLEERYRGRMLWNWTLLVELMLAKGDREEAVRISNHMAELDAPYPQILMHLGDRAGAVELMRERFGQQRKPLQALMTLHRIGLVPESMDDYAPFQELVGWPPPAPN